MTLQDDLVCRTRSKVRGVSARGFSTMTRLFFQRDAGCTLTRVRNRSATNWVITALLMFQLAIGLQWQVAHAVGAPPERQMSSVEAGHCPGHQAQVSNTDVGLHAGTSTSPRSLPDKPVPKHDCCHSLGCQCHGAQSPGALDLPAASAALSSSLLPILDARPPVARSTEFFRPPIA
jgi:hypothetical protein